MSFYSQFVAVVGLVFASFFIGCGTESQQDRSNNLLNGVNHEFLVWYEETVARFFRQQKVEKLPRDDKVAIAYRFFEAQKSSHIYVLIPGFGEPAAKYAELVYHLYQKRGLSVLVVDHRGQGDSGKVIQKSDVGHIEKFTDYCDDVVAVMQHISSQKSSALRFMGLGNSMGGAVLSRIAIDHDQLFDRIALFSPMLLIKTGKYSDREAYSIAKMNTRLGFGNSYVRGQGPWKEFPKAFRGTSDHTRGYISWNWALHNPQYRVGGPSNRWLLEALDFSRYLRKNAHRLRTKTLLVGAGEDHLVDAKAFPDFCNRAQDCQLIEFSKSRHEILVETDSIRDQALDHLDQFFAANG